MRRLVVNFGAVCVAIKSIKVSIRRVVHIVANFSSKSIIISSYVRNIAKITNEMSKKSYRFDSFDKN